MPFYTGRSADGSDMQEVEGMYVSPCGNYWSTEPFAETAEDRLWSAVYNHLCNDRVSLRTEYNRIIAKTSKLPAKQRAYIVDLIENEKYET